MEGEVSIGEGQWGLTGGAGSLSVPWPLPQRQLGQGDQRFATWDPPGAQILLCSRSLVCSSQEAAPWVHCAHEAQSRSRIRAKWAAFFFTLFSPKQFYEQAFVCPRCFCLCSDLILSVYPQPPNQYLFVMFHICLGARVQQICQDWSYLHLGKHNCAHALSSSSCMKGPETEKNYNQHHQEQQAQRDLKIDTKTALGTV